MMKEFLKKYAVSILTALVLGIGMAVYRDLGGASDFRAACSVLSDCFFLPGALMAGLGVLTFMASKGQYDAFGYIFSRFSLHSLIPGRVTKMDEPVKSFYEYKEKKNEKGRKWQPQMLWTGLACLAIAVIFTILYAV